MYFPSYNPTLHDLYLYGGSNTGLPIGLNPNCILYDARESYKSIGVRTRQFETQISPPIGPTAGTPLSKYPNYYNSGIPLIWKISETRAGACVHFMGRKPSDTLGNVASKQTGLTANYGIHFWNNDFTGLSYYVNFYAVYNCVEYQPESACPVYFSGSPEIPGFGTGATFYQIMQNDHGILEIIPESTPAQFTEPYLEAISIFTIAQEQNINIKDFEISENIYRIYPSDLYYIGGNDTVAPVISITVATSFLDFTIVDLFARVAVTAFIEYTTDVNFSFWVGDSSGLLVYKKNNKLYSIIHGLGTNLNSITGPSHANTLFPVLNYFVNETDISSYYYKSLSLDKKAAMGSQLENVNSQLQNLHTFILNTINTFTPS